MTRLTFVALWITLTFAAKFSVDEVEGVAALELRCGPNAVPVWFCLTGIGSEVVVWDVEVANVLRLSTMGSCACALAPGFDTVLPAVYSSTRLSAFCSGHLPVGMNSPLWLYVDALLVDGANANFLRSTAATEVEEAVVESGEWFYSDAVVRNETSADGALQVIAKVTSTLESISAL